MTVRRLDREVQTSSKRQPPAAAPGHEPPATLAALNDQILESPPPAHFSPRAVLGEGPVGATIALVGEQPGDREDLEGRPFVGAAGQLLDKALAEAGIRRGETYVTNAVKNFKYRQVGKRRIHQTPTSGEIRHYRWWLGRELDFIYPRLVVALGSTATEAMAGQPLPVMKNRGPTDKFTPWPGFITVHPSSLLRHPGAAARTEAFAAFVGDLARARAMATRLG
jgi:DNA polymerase